MDIVRGRVVLMLLINVCKTFSAFVLTTEFVGSSTVVKVVVYSFVLSF